MDKAGERRVNHSGDEKSPTKVRFTKEVLAKVVSCGALECVQMDDDAATYMTYDLNGGSSTDSIDTSLKESGARRGWMRRIVDKVMHRGNHRKSLLSRLNSEVSSNRSITADTNDLEYVLSKRSYKVSNRGAHTIVNESLPLAMTALLSPDVNKHIEIGGYHKGKHQYSEAKHSFVKALRFFRMECADLSDGAPEHDFKFRSQVEKCLDDKIVQINHLLTDLQHSVDIFTIGMVRLRRKEYEKALRSYNVALRVRQSVIGTIHPNLSTIYNYIAIVHSKLGDSTKALHFLNKAVNLLSPYLHLNANESINECERSYDIEYALTLRNFGQIYEEKNEMTEALSYYFDSLNMILVQRNKYQCDESKNPEEMLKRLKLVSFNGEVEFLNDIDAGSLPSNPKAAVEVCLTLNKMSQLYRRLNQLDSAILLSGLAVSCLRKAAGEDHPKLVAFLNHSSLLYRDAGEYDLALKMCGQVLVLNYMNNTDTLSSAHETTLTLFNLGCIEKDFGDSKKSMKFFQDAIEQQLKLKFQKRDNLLVMQIMIAMANIYENEEMYEKAEEAYSSAIRTIRSNFYQNHLEVGRLQHQFGQYYQRRGSYEDAQFELVEALKIYQANKRMDDSHPEYLMLQRDLADVKVILMMDDRGNDSLFACGVLTSACF